MTRSAIGNFEEALVDRLGAGDPAGLAESLSDLGRVYETMGEREEAISYFRSALAIDVRREDRLAIARDLVDIGRLYQSLGDAEQAARHFEQAHKVLSGVLAPEGLATVADPLGCGSTNEITPRPADIPGGTWTMYGSGATEKEALAQVLASLFANIYGKPKCKSTCPDGSTPPDGQCVADIKSSDPPSVTPGDYGSPAWKTWNKGGRVIIGPVKVTKFPQGLKAVQSCSACTKALGRIP